MDAYCTRQGQAPSSIRFIYDGNRLQDHETPKSVSFFLIFFLKKKLIGDNYFLGWYGE